MVEKILKWMSVDTSAAEESTFCMNNVIAITGALGVCVDQLCHDHPMGVYYYVCFACLMRPSYR